MIRLLLLATLGGLIYWIWKWTMSRYEQAKDRLQNRSPSPEGNSNKVSELVQDPVCKLYIAKNSAISYKGAYFCSEKCKSEYKE